MIGSSVSPDRSETTTEYPPLWAISAASSASERVPIWFTFQSSELAAPRSMPRGEPLAGW